MKRIGIGTSLCTLSLLAGAALVGCGDYDIPVDDPAENPGILPPRGIIRGGVSYFGPPPCFRNGEVEGSVVILLFDAANPPPPDGLASTALNFATVPGAKLFPNIAPPQSGAGAKGNASVFCPSIEAQPVSAGATWSMQQVGAGRYQVRAFYSRLGRWNPLFNFANLAIAGDVPGGVLADPRAAQPRFATVEVGVPIKPCAKPRRADGTTGDRACDQQNADAAANKLTIPESGFVREGATIALGSVLRTNRPYFHVDVAASNGFDVPPLIDKDLGGASYTAQRKRLTPDELRAKGYITFPQDHVSTSESNILCAGRPDPNCDLFEFAQASFPQIRFKYGFAGDVANLAAPEGPDAWIAKNAMPKQAFSGVKRRYYGIDPREFSADIPTSGKFALTRVFDKDGKPEILRDNETLETVAKIAEIFPSVVLSKLVDDGEGNLALPPRSQTDPIAVIQTITLKDWETGPKAGQGSMKATSEGEVAYGGLTNTTTITSNIACEPDSSAGKPCPSGAGYVCNATSKLCENLPGTVADPNHPLTKREGVVSQEGFTALVRPSVVCIYPQDDLRGTLVTPVQKDPNPKNPAADLVLPSKILELRANRVKSLTFGCLPPGYYSINVVYPTGQAWSFPNLSGHCSYTARSSLPGATPEQNEQCYMPNKNVGAGGFDWLNPRTFIRGFDPNAGFPLRPLLRSQAPFQYEDDGRLKIGPMPGVPTGDTRTVTLPQVVVITPSPRCGQWQAESALSCSSDASCPAPFKGACMAGKCDVNGDGKISTKPIWVNNRENEDISLDQPGKPSEFSANGILDPGEDKASFTGAAPNGKLDMHTPFTCALPRDKWAQLPPELWAK